MSLSAFISAQTIRHAPQYFASNHLPVPIHGIRTLMSSSTSSSSSLMAVASPLMIDTCLTFFETVKIPSALLATASLTSLFTFTREARDTYTIPKRKVMLLRVFHVLSLLSFCLSLMSLLTCHVGTTSLLLNSDRLITPKAEMDVLGFLKSNLNMEFLLARWSFVMSIFSFVASTTFRLIIEFGLFVPNRRLAGTMVVSAMTSFVCFMLSFSNIAHGHLPGLWPMTKEIALLVWYRAKIARYPLQIAALSFLGISLLCSLRFLFPGSIQYDQMLDTERYL